MTVFDLAIIGGGINGCGIARDASGRGLRVLLCEQGDLGGATSSASTKLIHGGLRYLEHYAFRLVREALTERGVLLGNAPHLIRPMRFVLPHHADLRPWWMLRAGLFIYDHLGGRNLPPTRTVELSKDAAGAPLKPDFRRAFEYSDAAVDDARLVILNALDAREKGADIRPRTRCIEARREGALWRVVLERNGQRETLSARALVNAAGPWAGEVRARVAGDGEPAHIRLVKGSHIVVPRLFGHDRAYIFQHGDGRVIFAIPYEHDFTLIGTTDLDFRGDPASPAITESETAYLCRAVSEYFRDPVTPDMVRWSYAGVRSLYDDGASNAQDATRDYVLDLDDPPGEAPALHIYGGKITTYRKLAEAALKALKTKGKPWTADVPLPGGDLAPDGIPDEVRRLLADYPFLSSATALRLVRAYGTRARHVVGSPEDAAVPGGSFGGGLHASEVRYLMRHEWAQTPEDILWRRTKLGLRINEIDTESLARFMAGQREETA